MPVTVIAMLTILFVGLTTVGSRSIIGPSPVSAATCLDQHIYAKVSGQRSLSFADGVRGDISYTNPTVCPLSPPHVNEFTGQSLSVVVPSSGQDGWVQVGWIKRHEPGWNEPELYCEFQPLGWPEGRELVEFPMGNSAHNYKFQVVTPGLPNPVWYCYLDNLPKWNRTVSYMGFESGSSLVAQ